MRKALIILFTLILSATISFAATKYSSKSGYWSSSSTWSPSGVPGSNDSVVIMNTHTVTMNNNYNIKGVLVQTGGELKFTSNKKLTMSGSLTVDGTLNMKNGNIQFSSGNMFTLGANSIFIWEPSSNNQSNATLLTNGVENFDPTSTFIVEKWFDFNVPVTTYMTGNFGNLTLNSVNGPWLYEWDQNNGFQTNQVIGKLSVDVGWIVLDKSGSISNTTIGSIELQNSNSYLDFHVGTHPGSFTVNTSELTINDGMLTCIYDGNGNATFNVNGNASIDGYAYLIYNDGVSGVGNGNVTFNCTGVFTQVDGDFRGVYNLTTYNPGKATMTFNTLNFNKGIFMVYYACNANADNISLTVNSDLNINFGSNNSIFRMVGLSTLSSTFSTAKLTSNISGNFNISGSGGAQFISNAAQGVETFSVSGNASFDGGTNDFNYGATGIGHTTTLTYSGNVTVSGGTTCFSRLNGTSTVSISGNLNITNGTLVFKGNVNNQTVNLSGAFTMSNGTLYMYDNGSTFTPDPVVLNIQGNFTHSGGNIEFNSNTSSSNTTHSVRLSGAQFNLTGNGNIRHSNPGTNTVFGELRFVRNGTVDYTRTASGNDVHQVRYVVASPCTLSINTGDFQIASHASTYTDLLLVESGGVFNAGTLQIKSNGNRNNSGVKVASGGTLITANINGLYDNTNNATFNKSNNLDFELDANSNIIYNGADNQVVTGIGAGNATGTNHKYGNLIIDFQGSANSEYAMLNASNVFVRGTLQLTAGELNLNDNTITIENGAATAVTRSNGYVKSETNNAVNGSIIKWMNMASGDHIFPFGVNSSDYIPITFTPITGAGGTVSISTRSTAGSNNQPWAGAGNVAAVTNMHKNGQDMSITSVIDRWYNIDAPGFNANVVLSYRGVENTTVNPSDYFSAQVWNGTMWGPSLGTTTGVTSGIGTITLPNFSTPGHIIMSVSSTPLPIELLFFDAELNNDVVDLRWQTATEKDNDYFTIERSGDGKTFEDISKVKGAGNSTTVRNYSAVDPSPLNGISYYRLKQTDYDGTSTHSEVVSVNYTAKTPEEANIISVGPNPFSNYFNLEYFMPSDQEVDIMILNINGQIVYNSKEMAYTGTNRFRFEDGSKLAPGNYILTLQGLDKKVTYKIVKGK
ncbi:MAG TPA: T9SS type A sorting domain-containing protein [Bacteroidia bacterium]|nr:T9SS type A sorting domain-containing protein [Bacteroidia bacterium]HNT79797.1 T9SS type A sorting domain-containing protein [Bacteroidia bacterium]